MPAVELEMIGTLPKAFLDSLSVGISLVDPHGRIIYANKECSRILGYTPDELRRERVPFIELTHPDDRERNLVQQHRLMSGEIETYRIQKRYLQKNGMILWADVTASVIRGSNGEIRWTAGVIKDITEQKFLQQQLAAAEQLGDLVTWNWDVKSGKSQTSPRYNRVFGMPDGAPIPSVEQFLESVHPEDRKAVKSEMRRALSGGAYSHEYRVVGPDGAIRWMRGVATGVINSANEVTNVIGATIDITAAKTRKQPELVSTILRDAMRHIEANVQKPISIPEIAAAYGVSPRSIHKQFSAHGMTPMTFVKQTRLRAAHRRLADPDRKTSVTGVAFECGFTNLGHFARDYRKEFGELPSETLKRNL
ncbi:MAG: putative transcriptional regulatory protein with sensor and domain [Tardiphaga sp.]|uniref:PAS domain-containing protein n=1 Tax=Tardiphaga sp. TaxID=1926292 RepID=UPI002615DDF1|nr:PAS domain-containing protein [Tardiphaga sp.]MDB5502422.1 putative transcriptional regulatory protein with sensor and domain [Tardiphaga sp.]